jgi:ubiquitin-protein ligase
MASPHLRRLSADWNAVRGEFSGHPNVTVEPLGPVPPERYRVTYHLRGLALRGEQPVFVDQHVCEIQLSLGYPREQPVVVPMTPIFHPNVGQQYCIADYWSAGETLVDVIAKVGDIIQYRTYNTKSPLDATAAYWAEQHPELFPVGQVELRQADVAISMKRPEGPQDDTVPTAAADNDPVTDDLVIELAPRRAESTG